MIADRSFDVQRMISFLEKNDEAFTRPLSQTLKHQGQTLEEYAAKLCAFGTVAYELDGDNISGMVIGYTHNLPEDNGSYITQVVTDIDHRRRGVCSRLMAEYFGFCRRQNISYVWLTTGVDNHSARATYEKCGFVLVEYENAELVKYIYNLKNN